MSLLPPKVSYIRQQPDGTWMGGPTNQGPWRPIPAPSPPRHLVALPPLAGATPPAPTQGATLWRRVLAAMGRADARAWGHVDAAEEAGVVMDMEDSLAMIERESAVAMLATIRLDLVNHLHNRGVSTAAEMVGRWFDQQIEDARKGK